MGYIKCGINEESSKIFEKATPTLITDSEKLEKYGLLFFKLQLYATYRDKFFVPFGYKSEYSNILFDRRERVNRYVDGDLDFSFFLLSDIIPDKREKKKLTSEKRLHVCHEASINLALNDDTNQTKVVIGYVPCIEEEVLHSILEFNQNGKDFVVDYTQNIVMNKDEYYEINQFRKISEVSSKTLKEDKKIMEMLDLVQPFYLIFRDEIIRDLKKNSKVLELED